MSLSYRLVSILMILAYYHIHQFVTKASLWLSICQGLSHKIAKFSVPAVTWYHFAQNLPLKHAIPNSPKLKLTIWSLICARVHRPQSLRLKLMPYRIQPVGSLCY